MDPVQFGYIVGFFVGLGMGWWLTRDYYKREAEHE